MAEKKEDGKWFGVKQNGVRRRHLIGCDEPPESIRKTVMMIYDPRGEKCF